jgi:hypothetical protein
VSTPENGAGANTTYSVNRHSGKRNPPNNDESQDGRSFEQRRIGRVVHDDRGSASVEWRDAPVGHERQKFEVEDTLDSGRGDSKLRGGLKLEVHDGDTFNPYDRSPDTFGGRPGTAAGGGGAKSAKRDLKKLSEWIKQMRAMEERKKNGDSE